MSDFLYKNTKHTARVFNILTYDIYDILNCNWVATQWQLFSTHLHTNNTRNVTKQIIHKITQKYIEQHKKTQNNTTIRKSAGRAPSLRVLPWHLPYN